MFYRQNKQRNSEDVEICNYSCVLSCCPLRVVEVRRHCDDCVLDFLAEVVLYDLFHLGQNHGAYFFGRQNLQLVAADLRRDVRLSVLFDDVVRDELLVAMDIFVVEVSADQTLDDVNWALGVDSSLVLGSFSDESFFVSEGNEGGSDSVTEFIGDDLDSAILENTDWWVCGSQINADHRSFN